MPALKSRPTLPLKKRRLDSRMIAMNTLLESNPKQTELSSQAGQVKPVTDKPTTQEMENWNKDKLLQWIQQKECHAMPNYVYGCGPCCEFHSQHSSLLGRMAEAMDHALQGTGTA